MVLNFFLGSHIVAKWAKSCMVYLVCQAAHDNFFGHKSPQKKIVVSSALTQDNCVTFSNKFQNDPW